MKMEEVIETVIKELKEILDDETAEINESSNIIEDLDISSLEILELIGNLEEAYDIELSEREIQKIVTVGDLAEHIQNKL